uniref:NOC3-like protein n=1 Tax=Panagrellus redivivus TaxID=6233 RepID=A0A7E4ZX66_PANRE
MAKKKTVKDLNRTQKLKLKRKLLKASRNGKLKAHQKEELKKIREAGSTKTRKRNDDIYEDYQADREYKQKIDGRVSEEETDSEQDTISEASDLDIGIDELDSETDSVEENGDEISEYREVKEEVDSDAEDDGIRRFKGELADDEKALLPIKLDNGQIVQRIRKIEVKEDDDSDEEDVVEEKKPEVRELSAAQLIVKRRQLLAELKVKIAHDCFALVGDPQGQFLRLKGLVEFAGGKSVDSLVREDAQKLATASLAKTFVEIAPGYAIRELTEAEKGQKQKKETKALQEYENGLLHYYLKFLKLLEKNVKCFIGKKSVDLESFNAKLGHISVKVMAQLAVKLSHFNYATNIISCLARIATSSIPAIVEEACLGLDDVLHEDVVFKMSLHTAKTIAAIVNEKKCYISPRLLETFLKLRIREVDNSNTAAVKRRLKIRKSQLLKERKSKSAKKFAHQVQQLEHDLTKVEASESISTKLKYATETMKHVFATYFRVLKRMPTTALLGPVLRGLAKYAHLLNVEFFDDLVATLEEVVSMSHIRVGDSLNCVKTVFVVLTGEGSALNIDPYRFYKNMYGILPAVPFQKDSANDVAVLVDCVDLLLVRRKKQVSISRVAAFVKRLLAIVFLLSSRQVIAILASLRGVFLNHPRLSSLFEEDTEAVSNGIFRPDAADPDTCNGMASSALPELRKLLTHPERTVGQFASHILAGLPSSGDNRLRPEYVSISPADWLTNEDIKDRPSPYTETITKFARKKKQVLGSNVLVSVVNAWLDSQIEK